MHLRKIQKYLVFRSICTTFANGAEDIVSLTGNGYQVEAFGKCFYYGYEFSEQVESSVRSAFIKYVKFTEDLQNTPDLTNFIKKAIDNLHKKINLYNYDLVVVPL